MAAPTAIPMANGPASPPDSTATKSMATTAPAMGPSPGARSRHFRPAVRSTSELLVLQHEPRRATQEERGTPSSAGPAWQRSARSGGQPVEVAVEVAMGDRPFRGRVESDRQRATEPD